MNCSPVLLFTYNRPWHTEETLKHLARNPLAGQTDLTIYSDGAKNDTHREGVDSVRRLLRNVGGFKSVEIVERDENLGLAKSIITGVTQSLEKKDSVIVLEDDIVVSENFLDYMNEALAHYADSDRVASIHAWNFPLQGDLPDTFFLKGADCWGWATWRRAWRFFEPDGVKLLAQLEARRLAYEFDMDDNYPYMQMLRDQIAGKNNSWAIRWHASAFLQNMLTLHPGRSLVQNIGLDGSGVHSKEEKALETQLSRLNKLSLPERIEIDAGMRKRIAGYLKENNFNRRKRSIIRGLASRIRRLFQVAR